MSLPSICRYGPFEARKAVAKLEESVPLLKSKNVSQCWSSERSECCGGTVCLLNGSLRWIIDENAISNQDTEDDGILPTSFQWYLPPMEGIIHDWVISRQLWWGHQILLGIMLRVNVSVKKPESDGWTQDEDVLDAWFSSAFGHSQPWLADVDSANFKRASLVTGYNHLLLGISWDFPIIGIPLVVSYSKRSDSRSHPWRADARCPKSR